MKEHRLELTLGQYFGSGDSGKGMEMITMSWLFIYLESLTQSQEGFSTSFPTLHDVGIQENLLIAKTRSQGMCLAPFRATLAWAQQIQGLCVEWTPVPQTPVKQPGSCPAPTAQVTPQ